MNPILYRLYTSRLWALLLALTGRVNAGAYVGRGHWMTLRQAQACVGPGWAGLIKTGFTRCLKHLAPIFQIKEKFGGLRFYSTVGMGDIEDQSYFICEECGKPGTLRDTGWWKTLCDECAKPEVRLRRREWRWQR